MDIDLVKLKSTIKREMRKATPKDTGNLAYRAMHGYITKDGIKVIYRGYVAGYGKILHVSPLLGDNKRNKHFGWHNRANANGLLAIRRFLKDKNIAKYSRMYNNKKEARYNPDVPGSGKPMFRQQEKWYENSARIRFETMNKV